jgi:hypothetical protein
MSTYNRPWRAQRGSRGIALLILDLGWSAPRPGRFTPGKDLVQEAGWAPGLVWTCANNLAPTGIKSSDRPLCNQSLYRLSYPAHMWNMQHLFFLLYVSWHKTYVSWPWLIDTWLYSYAYPEWLKIDHECSVQFVFTHTPVYSDTHNVLFFHFLFIVFSLTIVCITFYTLALYLRSL